MDDKLMKGFNGGDAGVLKTIYDMYYGHLYYFAYRLTGDMNEAEDITVDTLGILLRRHEDFNTMPNIKAFLYITVRNRSLKFLQQQQRVKELQKNFAKVMENKEDHILAQMVRAEFYREMYQEIEKLPPTQKRIIKLFFMEGLSTAEIAGRLNMPSEAVRNNKSRALKQLRNMLLSKKLLPFFAGMFHFIKS